MENDLITIIVPVYNAEKYLKNCIDSIINQTYKNIEIILINDGSRDGSKEICLKFQKKDNRIIFIDKKNQGVSSTRNLGIKKASGKYLCFIDADDWVEEDYIKKMHDEFYNKKFDVVKCSYYINKKDKQNAVQEKINYKQANLVSKQKNYDVIKQAIDGSFGCYVWLLMIKTSFLKDNLIYFWENKGFMEDVKFCVDLLLKKCNIYFLNEKLYHYRICDDSVSHRVSFNQIKKNFESAVDILGIIEKSYLNECTDVTKSEIQTIIDTRMEKEIDGTICKVFFNNKKNYKKILITIDKILKAKRDREFTKESLDNLNFYRRATIILFFNKKYEILRLFLIIRNVAHSLKEYKRGV